jgi:hypothetical protein
LFKDYVYNKNISFQLVPPYCHHHNPSERAIISFKYHLIAGLCLTDKYFHMHLWDRVLPQAVITLNMLQKSRINPKLSAATHLDGQHDYNRALLSPPGTIIIAHETPSRRRTWAPHGQNGYMGCKNAEHLKASIEKYYEISCDWTCSANCGLKLDWDYNNKTVDISIPGYLKAALHKFQHPKHARPEHAPHALNPSLYVAKIQFVEEPEESPPLAPKYVTRIQQL